MARAEGAASGPLTDFHKLPIFQLFNAVNVQKTKKYHMVYEHVGLYAGAYT